MVLALVGVAWIGGRAAIWENPFAPLGHGLSPLIAGSEPKAGPGGLVLPVPEQQGNIELASADGAATMQRFAEFARPGEGIVSAGQITGSNPNRMEPRLAVGHQMMLAAALAHFPAPQSFRQASALLSGSRHPARMPPFAPANLAASTKDRWSLDTWAFWRQGSNSSAVSQGRVPIYGASQVGANLQFRLAPYSPHDPRGYLRAYRALVANGESEVAFGLSARPFAAVPVRAQVEVRLTDNAFRTEARPAAFLVTEIAPQRLPGDVVAEAYGQGGYVGGSNPTAFADGQLTLSREVRSFDLADGKSARLSIGAGAWGGAQRDATRVDLGPTMRLDLTIGKVPARISVDWREQVAGDASPDSGVAATLSTRF
jgi:hypothetical protein